MCMIKLRSVILLLVAVGLGVECARAGEPHVATVVAAVRESVAKLKAADPQVVPMAFWDFDGTIIKGDVGLGYRDESGRGYRGLMEATMIAGLSSVYRGVEGHRRWLEDYRHFSEIGPWLSQGFDVQMYAGTPATVLADFCEKTIRDEGIDKWYFASSMAIWKALAEMGVENYVVSANVEPLVRGVAASLGIPRDRVRATQTAVVGGVITTRVLYPIPFGEGKVDAVRELVGARARGVAVAGFGNSYRTDGAFLRYIVSQRNLPGGAKPLAMMINGGPTPTPYAGLFVLVDQAETVASAALPPEADGTAATAAWAKWRQVTDGRIASIRATPNPVPAPGAAVYYLSPTGDDANDGRSPATAWRTVQRLNRQKAIEPGSYVLFERGGLWRVTLDLPNRPADKPFDGYDGGLRGRKGVTYSAYGEGSKPRLTASPFDGADPARWRETDVPGVWSCALGRTDVGNVVFDGGAAHGVKILPVYHKNGTTTAQYTKLPFRGYRDLTGDLHFYHDYSTNGIGRGTGLLYLRSAANPGARFKSIEFGVRHNIVTSHGQGDVTYDNLCLLYGGAHGIHHGAAHNLLVKNCEFGWIGGGIQGEGLFGRAWGVRYGNAVETGGCDGYTVTNCYVYQIYDAGLTHQADAVSRFDGKERRVWQKRIRYVGNVIEKCNYSIEYFLSRCPEANPSGMVDFLIADNLMWDAGKGLCEQRPDVNQDAHVKSWEHSNRATGYVIRNNVFAGAHRQLVQICSDLKNPDGTDSMPRLEDNVFIAAPSARFGTISQHDRRSSPVYWPLTADAEAKANAFGRGNRVYVLPR